MKISVASLLNVNDGEADAMTGRILDAALDELVDFGLRRFSVEDVARRAGINRVTIYRRFSGKDELLLAVVLREGRRLFARVDDLIAPLTSAEDQIVEGFAAGLAGVRAHPLYRRLVAVEPETVGSLLLRHADSVVAVAREYLAGHARRAQDEGRLPALDPDGAAELAARVTLSFLVAPASAFALGADDEMRAFARRYLVPALGSSRSSSPA